MPFEIESRHLDEVLVIAPRAIQDERGFFMETYRADLFSQLGITDSFVQDNHSRSIKGVLRGLHFQWEPPMGKLMRVTVGSAFLVAVDIRPGSHTAGRWFGAEVSAENKKQIWAPAYFARGFLALSDVVEVQYKCTGAYNQKAESGIRWNDPDIGIEWPQLDVEYIVSEKDQNARSLRNWLSSSEAQFFEYHEEVSR